jgi:hypothetical protein
VEPHERTQCGRECREAAYCLNASFWMTTIP